MIKHIDADMAEPTLSKENTNDMNRDIVFVGTGSGWGATNMGTGKGPEFLFNSTEPSSSSLRPFSSLSPHPAILKNFHDFDTLTSFFPLDDQGKPIREENALAALAHHFGSISDVLQEGFIPFSVGGDHSLAIGTWAAVKQHCSKFGLICIDAHLDAHTAETTPSQAMHGMSMAALLGFSSPNIKELIGDDPVISPETLVYIGARSFEEEEHDLLKSLGVKIYYMDEVKKRGFETIFSEAKAHITKHTTFYGISLDIDAFDPSTVPATGTKVPDGLLEKEVLSPLSGLLNDPHLICFELAELNPDLDEDDRALAFLWRITKVLLGETDNDETVQ